MQRTEKYKRKTAIDHVLDRWDTYVGSKRNKKNEEYILSKKNGKYYIQKKEITYSFAILRIFVEPLSNAIDNEKRSSKGKNKCNNIKVTIDPTTGKTTVWNDGDYIPIEKKFDEVDNKDVYVHSMIFGSMHSSSNYDDTEDRDVSGRNGLGVKLTNILSTEFTVKAADPETNLIFSQTWKNNMKVSEKPKIIKKPVSTGFTEISWIPDFEWFGIKGYSNDIIKLYSKYVMDAAMLTGVKVTLNNDILPVKTIKDYATLYDLEENTESLHIKTKNANVVISSNSSNEFEAISFVNGVYTSKGGKHVEAWSEEIFRPIVSKFNAKGKTQIKITDVKQFFRIIINCTVSNPEFESQSKHFLESPEVKASFTKTQMDKIMKWSVVDKIKEIIANKELLSLKKTESKSRGYKKVQGLDPANNSGTKHSSECILIICEGKSAKSYAVAGIEVGAYGKQGRDWFGIYPVRGKILNVRNASVNDIAKNNVVTDLIQALGVKYDVDYTKQENFKTLRYGKIMYLTDADVDGIHIGSLGINKLHKLFPSLLLRKEPFVVKMETPIAKVFTKPPKIFFDEREYNEFMLKTENKHKAKYYKGLGTSDASEVAETFGLKIIEFKSDENLDKSINKVFNDKQTDDRKTWIAEYDPIGYKKFINSDQISQIGISDYLNNYTIQFSIADNQRSLPHLMDGLKESQRKVIYACFKRNLSTPVKVAQLSGYVSEHTNYHHGEESLNGTIIGMAASFIGGNNIPYLTRNGFFGSRLEGGQDAAKPRYIFTKLETITRKIFRPEDDCLLQRVIDDGDIVEPKFYVPIIPMALVNQINGIGTGWSCNIPSFNPLDLVNCIKTWIGNDNSLFDSEGNCIVEELLPWYRGFTGEITKEAKNKYFSHGKVERISDKKVRITELPVGMWTTVFKEKLEDMLEKKQIKKIKNYSTPTIVDIEIEENGIKFPPKNLKLSKTHHTSNMVLWNEKDSITRYDSVFNIIDSFCKIRLEYYKLRKKAQVEKLSEDLKIITQKRKFINDVMKNEIIVFRKKKSVLEEELHKKGFEKDTRKDKNSYDYLIKLPVSTFTEEELKSLEEEFIDVNNRLETLKNTSETKLWTNELAEFSKSYQKMIKDLENEKVKAKKKTSKK